MESFDPVECLLALGNLFTARVFLIINKGFKRQDRVKQFLQTFFKTAVERRGRKRWQGMLTSGFF